jgi:hypothetical protein
MNLHSPSRPKNSRGALCLTIAPVAVPALTLVPRPLGGWYLYINVPVGFNEFKQWSQVIDDYHLIQGIIGMYENDPEDFLMKMCGMLSEFKQKELTTNIMKTGTQTGRVDCSGSFGSNNISNKPKANVEEIEF